MWEGQEIRRRKARGGNSKPPGGGPEKDEKNKGTYLDTGVKRGEVLRGCGMGPRGQSGGGSEQGICFGSGVGSGGGGGLAGGKNKLPTNTGLRFLKAKRGRAKQRGGG